MEATEIPEAVAMDILSRLPVKSLARFRCVCKPWSCSFQTSHFITKHYNNNVENNNLNLLLKRCRGHVRNVQSYMCALSTEEGQNNNFEVKEKENIHSPFFLFCSFRLQVDGPCNGLLCLSDANGDLALWNPSTREFKIIPKSTDLHHPSAMFVTFDGIGFGFDSTANDYKIVRFVRNHVLDYQRDRSGVGELFPQVVLYSLKSDSWKEIPAPNVVIWPGYLPNYNCCINGYCYWRQTRHSEVDLVLSFDMANEKFSTIPLPISGGDMLLLDFHGLLGAMFYPRDGTEKPLDLWVMNLNGGSWTKQFSIEPVPGVERPLGFWKNGEIFLESSNHELVLFDPSTREIKNLGIMNLTIDDFRKKMQLIAYFESLVPINGISEDDETIIRQPAAEASSGL